MLAYISKVLPQFFYPLAVAALLLVIGFFMIKKKPKGARWMVFLAFLIVMVAGNTYFSAFLTRSMEWRYMPPAEAPKADAIVLLGGGTESPDTPRQMVEVNGAGDRVLYAAKLYREGAAPVIILSGGNLAFSEERTHTPAEEMRALLLGMGVPEEAMLLEDRSQNTAENAEFTRALLKEKGYTSIILVTSAMHMDRSVLMFRDDALTVIPAPADYSITKQSWDTLMRWDWKTILLHVSPSSQALDRTSTVLHEYLGILFYRISLLF